MDAGTAHIVWAEGGDSGRPRRSRPLLPAEARIAPACDASHTLRAGPESSYNTDYLGPRIVRVGDQLVVFTRRYPVVVDKPDGGSSNTVYAWTSNDGGGSWSDPAIVGSRELGDMVVMGPSDDPTILNFARRPVLRHVHPGGYKSGQYSGDPLTSPRGPATCTTPRSSWIPAGSRSSPG